jgi:hypothetical protein
VDHQINFGRRHENERLADPSVRFLYVGLARAAARAANCSSPRDYPWIGGPQCLRFLAPRPRTRTNKIALEPSIPEDVVHFIRECIDRLETLDVLLLLQSARTRAWTIRQVSDEMRSSPLAVEGALQTLHSRGLLGKDGETFTFRPGNSELEEKTSRLAACYREKRTAVITTIFSKPNEAVRSFAEAFRIKKGGSDG